MAASPSFLPWIYGLFLVTILACQRPTATETPGLAPYFAELPAGDTLHVEISPDMADSTGKWIPNKLFFSTVPVALLEPIDYLADSAQAAVYGRQRFSLNDSTTAYWVHIKQFWFQNHSLLLYNRRTKTYTDRVTLAEWYGGESGQILTGSWLFDFDGDGKKDVVRQEIEHHTEIDGEEWTEHIRKSATLLLLKGDRFNESPLPDTQAVIRRFPIRSFW